MSQEDFIRLYDVRNIWNYTLDEGRCHNGSAPTIRQCVKDYGREAVRNIVRQHLDTFIEFCKAKDKPTARQRDTIVWFVMSQYDSLKITEFQLWVIKAMSGAFGKFYNTLDPMDITTALRQWVRECNTIRNEARAQREREEAQREREEAVVTAEDQDKALQIMERICARLRANR